MKLNTCLFVALSFICLGANALETDQYMTWGVELKDSGNYINKYLNEKIESALKELDSDLSQRKPQLSQWIGMEELPTC